MTRVLAEFARTMVTDFPVQAILNGLVEQIVEVLEVTAAGVTLVSAGGRPVHVAASDGASLRFEGLQSELGEGPCVEASRTGRAVAVGDVAVDARFGQFMIRARQAGLGAVFAFPLRHGDEQLGALDLYCEQPQSLPAATMSAAQTLADVAAAYILNARARSDLRTAADRARELSRRDDLTGLANRVVLLENLTRVVARARRGGHTVAVAFVDLDRFKDVNDRWGHRVGDALLVAVANRLRALVRPGDTLGRLSGDEFLIVCDDLGGPAQADLVAYRVGAALAAPFALADLTVTITASVGVAFAADDATAPEDILHAADLAMYEAKRRRSGGARRSASGERPSADTVRIPGPQAHATDDGVDLRSGDDGPAGGEPPHARPTVGGVSGPWEGVRITAPGP